MPKQKDPFKISNLFKDFKAKPKEEEFYNYDSGKKEEPIHIEEMKHEEVPEVEETKKQTLSINKPTNEMTYKDKNKNILERHTMTPVSEIKLNNQLLTKLVYLGWAVFIYVVFMTGYIIYNNVANNLIATIWGQDENNKYNLQKKRSNIEFNR